MPTYEYVCEACGHQWEAFQSIKDSPLTDCASCKAKAAKRQVSAGLGFILKGGGWYADLYASGGKSSSNGNDKPGEPKKNGDAKTETPKTEKKANGAGGTADKPAGSSKPSTTT
jgi:putative FmdB family regulatory protein